MRARNDLEIKNALPFFHSENGDGNQLYYEEKGSGEPFIFLHGNGENSSYFRNQIEHYQNRYRVLALDTRGHGKSPRGTAPFTIEQFSCDLYDFMRSHGISKALILGFSDGANIAMTFAMKHVRRYLSESPGGKAVGDLKPGLSGVCGKLLVSVL